MNIKQINNIYCLGIGGIGVSALARLFLAMGKNVQGSDIKESVVTEELEKLGIKVSIGPNPTKVPEETELIIYTQDIPSDVLTKLPGAKISQAEALGLVMEDKYGIGVTGTNGKSTTTALLGLILDNAGMDPTVLIGSLLSPDSETEKFKANARIGDSEYFVTESDEYHRKMLANKPKMIVLTNIALDHLDYYKDLADIKSAFTEYVESLPDDGMLIYNADDHNATEVGKFAHSHKFTYGIHHYADLQAINLKAENGKQTFDLHLNDQMIGNYTLPIPGTFNVLNALGAVLAGIKLGVPYTTIKITLAGFVGIWRRFEKVGELMGKTVISDYAHHPDAISATLSAAKQFYPGKKILTVFQPHHRNRTKALFGEFVESMITADEIILPEIFDVAGREHGEDISSKQLVDELNKKGAKATFMPTLDAAEKLIREKAKDFDVILLMGAGDIDLMARKLVK
ncbi:MAG: UDP-N-acetylmuramate--L-alanine ligase [Candidatus Doudnabacteria bacterium]|nr:UDP-N-acetylmuramate--L-alanine ligase [Candidatus Doudnabacteria bacterium]